jgi:hypothetical protein
MKASYPIPAGSSGSRGVLGIPAVVRRVSRTMGGNPAPSDRAKRKCGQCPHFRPRTGPYSRRIGPHSACFRWIPAMTRPRITFESHLGHGIPPRQRGFLL